VPQLLISTPGPPLRRHIREQRTPLLPPCITNQHDLNGLAAYDLWPISQRALAARPVIPRIMSSYCARFHEPEKTRSTGDLTASLSAHRQHFKARRSYAHCHLNFSALSTSRWYVMSKNHRANREQCGS